MCRPVDCLSCPSFRQVLRRRRLPVRGAPGPARRRLRPDHLRGGGGGRAGAEGRARADVAREEDTGD